MGETVRDRLNRAMAGASKADRAISNFMLTTFATIPFETAASIASKVKVSEPTVGRFCRSIGYKSFKDLKEHLKDDIDDSPWLVSDRLRDLQERTMAGEDQLARGLKLEMAALMAIYEHAQTPDWDRVVQRLATKPRVFVTGFQTERGIAQFFANQLQYIRSNVQLIDLAAGNFSEILASDEDACLVIFEARRYSRMAKILALEAHAAGVPVTLITDEYCDWGRESADEVFAIPTSFNQFWDSTAQMASFGNLMINSIFIELGPDVEKRMNKFAELYGRFTGHLGGSAKRR